jgi:hypothetical protein
MKSVVVPLSAETGVAKGLLNISALCEGSNTGICGEGEGIFCLGARVSVWVDDQESMTHP